VVCACALPHSETTVIQSRHTHRNEVTDRDMDRDSFYCEFSRHLDFLESQEVAGLSSGIR
jgi:hypothetical protein